MVSQPLTIQNILARHKTLILESHASLTSYDSRMVMKKLFEYYLLPSVKTVILSENIEFIHAVKLALALNINSYSEEYPGCDVELLGGVIDMYSL